MYSYVFCFFFFIFFFFLMIRRPPRSTLCQTPFPTRRSSDLPPVLGWWRHTIWTAPRPRSWRSEEHTSELQSPDTISYAVFCLKKKKNHTNHKPNNQLTTNRKKQIQKTQT